MGRIIFFVIVTYVFAQVIGIVLRYVRRIVNAFHAGQNSVSRNTSGTPPTPYRNVEDVEYEDISDKK
jgi:hypothetical protein